MEHWPVLLLGRVLLDHNGTVASCRVLDENILAPWLEVVVVRARRCQVTLACSVQLLVREHVREGVLLRHVDGVELVEHLSEFCMSALRLERVDVLFTVQTLMPSFSAFWTRSVVPVWSRKGLSDWPRRIAAARGFCGDPAVLTMRCEMRWEKNWSMRWASVTTFLHESDSQHQVSRREP